MRYLCHLKCFQDFPGHFCRFRVAATVALKFIDDLALTRKMPLTIANMAFNVSEVIEQHRSLHAA
jgi:hypothetical protein